ncbi:chromosomal replication initiator protein DnaA [Polynucleobacter kasalickyi]|uniref:Chromosomal replication initiator protein DnaA n=1 Tax=Polynucleobacter kasalickyi TaxID=1938817 RepID=A0A1W2BRQ7_9BURK|nr:chromosomal replication initiator protein DnaA [Polynucleobacter kasalickyi]SMC75633.1 chromosomal replication initiator protein DnaA [Polynucleobacter kasalickyi]
MINHLGNNPETESTLNVESASVRFWNNFVLTMEKEMPSSQFRTWIKPLAPIGLDNSGNIFVIAVPNQFKLDWIKNQFTNKINDIAKDFLSPGTQIRLIVDSQACSIKEADNSSSNNFINKSPEPDILVNDADDDIDSVESINFKINVEDFSKLSPILTFDTFVNGKANQLARAAAIQVANNPGTSYNPMFLYGGVGLGKTHLIHAVGNYLLKQKPNAKIRYIHAEQYVSDVVRAYQQKAFDKFKSYYHSLDLLLIDDIQFFSGKNRTQEEFFYAFEALISNKSQIIITSDTYPKEMDGIDDRLISRFDSGLTVAIEPPELEMRVAILMKKAQAEFVPMSEDVAFFIAKHLRSNIRELEGALRKILAYVRFHGKEVNIDVAKEALKDLLSIQNRQISVENIQKAVADFYGIKVADMYSKKRPANIAKPRQIAMYIAKELTQKSLPEIGELFGGRDHTTVLHAVRRIIELRSLDSQLNHELHVLEQTLKA